MIAKAAMRRWKAAADYALAGTTIIAIIVAWELICDWARVPVWLLPSPTRIVAATWDWRGLLPEHILATLWAVIGGFLLAVAVGVPIAIAVVYSPFLRRVIYPWLLVLQSVPKVALAPLLLIWVGYGLRSNIVVAAVIAFFPIVINTAAGLQAVAPELLDLTHSLDSSKFKVFWKVRLPWALPYLFSSLKIAITLAVIGAVVGEFIGSAKGLGYLILASTSNMNTALTFGIIVILSLLGILCFYAVCFLEKVLCPWYLPTDDASF